MRRRIILTGAGLIGAQIGFPAVAAVTETILPAARSRKARAASRSAIARIRTASVLKVSVVQQFPWSTVDQAKVWSGYDVDVCNRLAADLDVKAEFVDAAWSAAADDVAQGVTDLAASLQPTPRRLLVANFSRPYGTSQATLVANRQKAMGLTTLADFNRPGIVVGVRGKSDGERIARELLDKAQIRVVGDDAEALDGLVSGELTAMVALTPLPEILAARAPDQLVQPLGQPLRRRSECFAVRVDDGALLEYLNSWIRYSEESGFLAERRRFWFSGDAKPSV
jgi:polar amino acid transport system substrate-binding protein